MLPRNSSAAAQTLLASSCLFIIRPLSRESSIIRSQSILPLTPDTYGRIRPVRIVALVLPEPRSANGLLARMATRLPLFLIAFTPFAVRATRPATRRVPARTYVSYK